MPVMTSKTSKLNQDKQKYLIPSTLSVKESMLKMGEGGERILVVVNDEGRLLGVLTDGDIRRAVLNGRELSSSIEYVFNKNPLFQKEGYDVESVKDIMVSERRVGIPIVDENNEVVDILLWDEIFNKEESQHKKTISNISVVIMAGGKGTRLDPFTKVLPKPLIPIGDKTIIEIIMDKFKNHGISEFYLSINHKSRMIKAFFDETSPVVKINYVEEDKPLGTIGSLRRIAGIVGENVIVSNCDIIINSDYSEIVNFHKTKRYDVTIVGSFRHFTIPYGVCHIHNGGELTDIQEKPEYDFLANTGMYVLKKDVINLIPKDTFFNITDLIERVKQNNGSVGVFPIDARSWIDVGQWEEYRNALRVLKLDD